jgi:hypothetical protein
MRSTNTSKPGRASQLLKAGTVLMAATACGGLVSWSASAATVARNFSVQQIVIDDVAFGGCMAALSPNPANFISGCAGGFVTFDCLGQLGTSKSSANSKLAAAQLALVTDTQTFIRIDNTKIANGYCLAVRVDNTKTPSN